jgi:3'-phosphoadenosine 5'-phosphosulfate sulfotransferase (PAPS reductase)/FAD synthetase
MKTEALKQALDKYKFDAAFGGARRDEEKSRAKERIFSFRSASIAGIPKRQRPETLELYNTRIQGRERCACSRCPTGPSSTSGNTSADENIESCRSTLLPNAPWCAATADHGG